MCVCVGKFFQGFRGVQSNRVEFFFTPKGRLHGGAMYPYTHPPLPPRRVAFRLKTFHASLQSSSFSSLVSFLYGLPWQCRRTYNSLSDSTWSERSQSFLLYVPVSASKLISYYMFISSQFFYLSWLLFIDGSLILIETCSLLSEFILLQLDFKRD